MSDCLSFCYVSSHCLLLSRSINSLIDELIAIGFQKSGIGTSSPFTSR